MKCPVCGHKVRPSKKYPGKYLCDTCRKYPRHIEEFEGLREYSL